MNGTLTASYELPTPALEFRGTPLLHPLTSVADARATLERSASGLTLTVEMRTANREGAAAVANALAAEFAKFLTLHLADHIGAAVVAKRTGVNFVPDDPTANVLLVEHVSIAFEGPRATLITGLSIDSAAAALTEFDLRRSAPTPAFAADLAIAREMFFVGMTIENLVIRFLTLYSSLALLATFKGGNGDQAAVDRLLTAEDPSIRTDPPPPSSGKTRHETPYTAARNTLIHAESRGKNPAAAIAEVERITPEFRSLVARILKKG